MSFLIFYKPTKTPPAASTSFEANQRSPHRGSAWQTNPCKQLGFNGGKRGNPTWRRVTQWPHLPEIAALRTAEKPDKQLDHIPPNNCTWSCFLGDATCYLYGMLRNQLMASRLVDPCYINWIQLLDPMTNSETCDPWNSTDSALRSSLAASPWPSRSSCCLMVKIEISVDSKSGHLKWSEILRMCSMMVQVPWWFMFHHDSPYLSIRSMSRSEKCQHPLNLFTVDENSCLENSLRVWRLHSPNCLRSSCLACVFRKQTSWLYIPT